jgi:plasmid stability protein
MVMAMAALNIRNLPDETHRALRVQAARNSRSMEAEARAILEQAIRPADRERIGSALVEIFRPLGGVDIDIARNRAPAEPESFEP